MYQVPVPGVTAPLGIPYKVRLQLNLVHKVIKMEQKSKTGDFAVFASRLQCSLLSFLLTWYFDSHSVQMASSKQTYY